MEKQKTIDKIKNNIKYVKDRDADREQFNAILDDKIMMEQKQAIIKIICDEENKKKVQNCFYFIAAAFGYDIIGASMIRKKALD